MRRDVALCIVFTIITCGIYGIYWFYCLTEDANKASLENEVSGGMAILFTLITCGIYGIYWCYRMGVKLNNAKVHYGMNPDTSMPILYLVLSVLQLDIIAWALMQNELNRMLPDNAR